MTIDIGDLNAVARLLATGAMGIDELGSDPAPMSDACAAAPLLVEALGSIASALDAAVRSLASATDATQDSLRAYQDAESHTAQEITKAREG